MFIIMVRGYMIAVFVLPTYLIHEVSYVKRLRHITDAISLQTSESGTGVLRYIILTSERFSRRF